MENFFLSLSAIIPIFSMILAGIFLRKIGILHKELNAGLTRLVYFVFLPSLVFRMLAKTSMESIFSLKLFFVIWGTVFLNFFLVWLAGLLRGKDSPTRKFLAAGASWSNVAIVGYAISDALYGEAGLARAALFTALAIPIHNFIGFFAMKGNSPPISKKWRSQEILTMAKNPLLISLLAGVLFHFLPFPLPPISDRFLDILGRASLPLALLVVGASLEFSRDKKGSAEALSIATAKLFLLPLLGYGASRLFLLDVLTRNIVVLSFSCPTAMSFYMVSCSFRYDPSRGAKIITVSTLGSILSIGIIVTLLRFAS